MNVSDDGCWCWPGTFQSVDNVCPWASILLICCRAMSGPSDRGGIDYLQAPSPPWHKVRTLQLEDDSPNTYLYDWQSILKFVNYPPLTLDSRATIDLCQCSKIISWFMFRHILRFHCIISYFLVITTNLGFCTRVGVTNHPMTEDLESWEKYLR